MVGRLDIQFAEITGVITDQQRLILAHERGQGVGPIPQVEKLEPVSLQDPILHRQKRDPKSLRVGGNLE